MVCAIKKHKIIQQYCKRNNLTNNEEEKKLIVETSKILKDTTNINNVAEAIGYILNSFSDNRYIHYNFNNRYIQYRKYNRNNIGDTLCIIDKFIFNRARYLCNRDILETLYIDNYKEIEKHCLNISNFYNEAEDKFLQSKIHINNQLLFQNDLIDIHKSLLLNRINGREFYTNLNSTLFKNFFINNSNTKAFYSLLHEYCNLFKVPMYKMRQEDKIKELENFYHNRLKDTIDNILQSIPDSEKARIYMGINTNLWKVIVKKYHILIPSKIYDVEGNLLDSKEESFLDNYFHKRNIKHKKISKNGSNCKIFYDKVTNSNFIPDWIINDNIIVEYFGYIKTGSAKYAKNTIKKQEYFISLKDFYFISIFPRNLTEENLDHIFNRYL